MKTPNEPLRDWARNVAAALAICAAIGVLLLAGVTVVLNFGTVAGIGTTMLLAALAVGTGVWWAERKARA